MSPYIGIYNSLIRADLPHKANWDLVKSLHNDIHEFEINESYWENLIDILSYYGEKVDTIYISYDHSAILDAMLDKSISFPCNLYNIDYHHDLLYSPQQKQKIYELNMVDCSCWAGYLASKGLLNSYSWFYGKGSIFDKTYIRNTGIIKDCAFEKKLFSKYSFPMDLQNVKILFLTFSEAWIPPHLLERVKSIYAPYSNKIKVLSYPFYIPGVTKEFY